MDQAMGDVELEPGLRQQLQKSFFQTADWMRNQ
jgi:hemoglobin